ncbi:HU family DNA-binding protein [Pseudomonas luteola]|uniref:HU family DNA-binding protein n=1 Tax=Pseudomonas luteola TaxID=47886 RepID=UPI00123A8C8E|nr:HU family DNA-binding protein [Pseudomonas luteola]QEU26645.1 HU family DNA-binding protein [Pseudomonas luteola]
MNKSELVKAISEKGQLTLKEAEAALNGFIESVTESVKDGQDVVLVGFGTFSVKERAARTGRNPQTGKPIEIAASKSVAFKPGKQLKESIA